MHGLEAVACVGQRARDDDAHRVIEVGAPQLVLDRDGARAGRCGMLSFFAQNQSFGSPAAVPGTGRTSREMGSISGADCASETRRNARRGDRHQRGIRQPRVRTESRRPCRCARNFAVSPRRRRRSCGRRRHRFRRAHPASAIRRGNSAAPPRSRTVPGRPCR